MMMDFFRFYLALNSEPNLAPWYTIKMINLIKSKEFLPSVCYLRKVFAPLAFFFFEAIARGLTAMRSLVGQLWPVLRSLWVGQVHVEV